MLPPFFFALDKSKFLLRSIAASLLFIENSMSRKHTSQELDIPITHLAHDGLGIGTVVSPRSKLPITVSVPFTLPGDTVRAVVGRKQRGQYKGYFREVIEPSPGRTVPRCAHFYSCGGCLWQHIPYERQLAIKEQNIVEYFSRYQLNKEIAIEPIIPAIPSWHYRNKMEFSFSSDKSGARYLGLYSRGSRGKVLNITECHLVSPWMVEALQTVRQWWSETDLQAYHHSKNSGSLRTLTLREGVRSGDRMAILTVSGNPEYALNSSHLETLVLFLRSAMESSLPGSQMSIFLNIQQIEKGKETNFFEMQLFGADHIRETLFITAEKNKAAIPYTFTISPSAFFQPNTLQAEKLYSAVLQLAAMGADDVVYDLYCGTGTLGISAAHRVKSVIGIELSPESALDAKTNMKNNNVDNVTILCGDVAELTDRTKGELNSLPQPTIALVDPPRAGLTAKALRHLLLLAPKTIVYVSCNPATQAENISQLCLEGYRLCSLQPVDQFPYTPHIENIALLTRL